MAARWRVPMHSWVGPSLATALLKNRAMAARPSPDRLVALKFMPEDLARER